MVELTRTIRAAIPLGRPTGRSDLVASRGRNTYAAWPSPAGICAFLELHLTCCGDPDPLTGYLVNIVDIDRIAREVAIPIAQRAVWQDQGRQPVRCLQDISLALAEQLPVELRTIEWSLTPYHSLSVSRAEPNMVLLTESFSFAAAHRLNCEDLPPEENLRIFGKCNRPNGHGHNYRIDIAVAYPTEHGHDLNKSVPALEGIVHDHIIEDFDHRNLDVDVPEFSEMSSSVENIAHVCFDRLSVPIRHQGGELRYVRVWETEKTSATYPA